MDASEDLEKFRVAGGSPGRRGGSDAISSSSSEAQNFGKVFPKLNPIYPNYFLNFSKLFGNFQTHWKKVWKNMVVSPGDPGARPAASDPGPAGPAALAAPRPGPRGPGLVSSGRADVAGSKSTGPGLDRQPDRPGLGSLRHVADSSAAPRALPPMRSRGDPRGPRRVPHHWGHGDMGDCLPFLICSLGRLWSQRQWHPVV
jgi:hypothetical protein